MTIADLRRFYHQQICQDIIRAPKGYPNFSDGSNRSSRSIAWGIVKQLGFPIPEDLIKEQTAGDRFETLTKNFLQSAFSLLQHLRPGEWYYSTLQTGIAGFEQYEHLAYLESIVENDKNLASALGGDYIIHPDIVIGRMAVTDESINQNGAMRIASLALGTGDLDCVYHFALPELKAAILEINNEDQLDLLNSMIDGRRLRDISDLAFDLAI